MDSGIPNIIDSLLIDLDNLQLGADFTEEMTFTGYHNISHMTMSFRVECSPGFCGPDCTTNGTDPQVAKCQADGSLTCYDNFDPTTKCTSCLQPDRFTDTDCSVCALPGGDPATLCQTCLSPGKDPNNNCTCKDNYDESTDCFTCVPGWDSNYDCSVCLTGRNMSTDCTTCIPGYSGEDCLLGESTMIYAQIVAYLK